MNPPASLPSLRSSVGWAFCVALAATLLSLLVAPPSMRELPALGFPQTLPLIHGDVHTAGTLVREPVDIIGAGGWHLPPTCRYRYLPNGGESAAGDVDILATYYNSPRTDARQFPELYATCPWWSPNENENAWVSRSAQHAAGQKRAWLEVDDRQGIYFVTRISPKGECTSTSEQVEGNNLAVWRDRPWVPLSWPFSKRPETDQRALWVRMTVNERVDGNPRSMGEAAQLWQSVMQAFAGQAPSAPTNGPAK